MYLMPYIAGSLCAGLAGPAPAQPSQANCAGAVCKGAAQTQAVGAVVPARDVAGLGSPAAAGTLDGVRGGSADMASNTRLGGVVRGNTASGVVTGANIIGSGAFADVSGVPVVIQNSGANVLIQNATVINLQLR